AITVRRRLAWYNPVSWILEGLFPRAELLHAQWWSLPLFPIFLTVCILFKLRKKPVVFTVHNVLPHDNSRLYKTLSGLLFKLGDHFIVHTTRCRQQMTEHYRIPITRISVIAHGSLDFHVREKSDPLKIKKEMGFCDTDRIILLFGAVRAYKGIDTAIKAMAEVVKQIPEARLLIAGKLWEDWAPYQRLINRLKLSDHITLNLEYIPSNQVYRFFEISDLCIFPYRHFDSQSGAGATAVSFRKPLIVTNVGGLPELAAGDNAIVEPDAPQALANKIIRFFQDPAFREQMTANTGTVSQKLNWAYIAKETLRVYKKTIEQKEKRKSNARSL
ncbi:MAG: glycosyltransferase, partial [Desulfobacterales bacterium]